MKETSERILPDYYLKDKKRLARFLFHQRCYELILSRVERKNVLDLGCGTGYGSNILKEKARYVTGVDISEEAIKDAKKNFKKRNLQYKVIDTLETGTLPFLDGTFDVVVSFQVLEHIKNVDNYFYEINRVLKEDGELIIITPNRKFRLFSHQYPWNHHHIKEYNYYDLKEVLKEYYCSLKIKGVTLKNIFLKQEMDRVGKLRIFSFPFSNTFFFSDKTRRNLLEKIWNLVVGKEMKKENKKADSISVDFIEKVKESCILEEDREKKWLHFICFCKRHF